MFLNTLNSAVSKVEAQDEILEAIKYSEDGIMVLDRYAPWQDFIFNVEDPELKAKADNIMYVIYPGNRGGYQ